MRSGRRLVLGALLLLTHAGVARAEPGPSWGRHLVGLTYVGSPGGSDAADGSTLTPTGELRYHGALERSWTHLVELKYLHSVGPIHLGATLGYGYSTSGYREYDAMAGLPSDQPAFRDAMQEHQLYGLASLEWHLPFDRTAFCRRIRHRIHPWVGVDFGPGATLTAHRPTSGRSLVETHTFVRLRGRVGVHLNLYGPWALEVFGHFGGDNAVGGIADPGSPPRVMDGSFRFVGGVGAGVAALL